MSGNARDRGRSSASRLLAVLAAFTAERPAMSLSTLAEVSGLPIATTHRLANELLDWGALQRREDGEFCIGFRLWNVGALAPAHRDLRSVALPFMGDLHEATGENVQLAVRDGTSALYLDKISGQHSVPTRTEVAGRLPLHATGVGKVFLAFSERAVLDAVVAEGLARCTPHTIVLPGVLARALDGVRRSGVGVSREEMTVGASSIAAPVFGAGDEVVASVALVVRSTTNLKALAPAIRTAAAGMSRLLRGRPVELPAPATGPKDAVAQQPSTRSASHGDAAPASQAAPSA